MLVMKTRQWSDLTFHIYIYFPFSGQVLMIVLETGIRVSTYCRCAVTFAKSKSSDFSPIHVGGNFLYENEKTGLVFTPSHLKVGTECMLLG